MGGTHSTPSAGSISFLSWTRSPVPSGLRAYPATAEAFTANWAYETFETNWSDLVCGWISTRCCTY
jgi:hypothetical protein